MKRIKIFIKRIIPRKYHSKISGRIIIYAPCFYSDLNINVFSVKDILENFFPLD
jgi:hypothetical protein